MMRTAVGSPDLVAWLNGRSGPGRPPPTNPTRGEMRVALVVMPFADAVRPSLAAGLLQALVRERGIECESKYFSIALNAMIGPDDYRYFSGGAPLTALAGEWCFSQEYYGSALSDWESYQQEVLDLPCWGMHERNRGRVEKLRDTVPAFLDRAFASEDWSRYDMVGFTSTFEQTMPSMCLARRIKEAHPDVLIAAGGANFEAEMGRPYIESFGFLDFVANGEADQSFPELCERIRDARSAGTSFEVPGGFLYRAAGKVRASPPSDAPVDLNLSPVPDYGDFFAAFEGEYADHLPSKPWLPVESARGCWWGAKAHCTFCGLNGTGMAFRTKSWKKVVAEANELAKRHGDVRLQYADNILGMEFFNDLIPFWAETEDTVPKFFEIKSSLSRDQVQALADAGVVHLQAGVETLSASTLKLMRKGVSAAQNLALLRWCSEIGIEGRWNLLFGFPGEDLEELAQMSSTMRKLVHLVPPSAVASIRLDRFSPNFTDPSGHGFRDVEPMPSYRHVFAFSDEQRRHAAYYFNYDHDQLQGAREAGRLPRAVAREWRERWRRGENGRLAVEVDAAGPLLVDTRYDRPPTNRRLSPAEVALILACDAPASPRSALERAAAALGIADGADGTHKLSRLLETLREDMTIVEMGGLLVSLPLLRNDVRDALHRPTLLIHEAREAPGDVAGALLRFPN